ERVIEVHPEVSFRELARRPLLPKRRADGLAERRALLEQAGIALPAAVPRVAEPDLLDATVAAWSAQRYARGEALALPRGHGSRTGTCPATAPGRPTRSSSSAAGSRRELRPS